jgi:hypothetical protein
MIFYYLNMICYVKWDIGIKRADEYSGNSLKGERYEKGDNCSIDGIFDDTYWSECNRDLRFRV